MESTDLCAPGADTRELAPRLFEFAVAIVKLVDTLPQSFAGRHIAGQLMRAGTSIATSYDDALIAADDAERVQTLREAYRHAGETRFWLQVLHETGMKSNLTSRQLLQDAEELYAVIGAAIATP